MWNLKNMQDLHQAEIDQVLESVRGIEATEQHSWETIKNKLEKISVKPGPVVRAYSLHSYGSVKNADTYRATISDTAALLVWLIDFVMTNFFKDGKFKRPPIRKYPKIVGFFFMLIWKVYKLFK